MSELEPDFQAFEENLRKTDEFDAQRLTVKCLGCPALKACAAEYDNILNQRNHSTIQGEKAASNYDIELHKQTEALREEHADPEAAARQHLSDQLKSIGASTNNLEANLATLAQIARSVHSTCHGPIDIEDERRGNSYTARICSSTTENPYQHNAHVFSRAADQYPVDRS